MKKILCLLIALLCLIGSALAQKKVAVYVTGEVSAAYKKVIGSKMVSAITRSEGYSAVERTADFLAVMTEEQEYQASGAVNDKQVVRLGQQFGVRYVVVVEATELFDEIFISARLIDVQTAKIVVSIDNSKNVENMSALVAFSEGIATDLVKSVDVLEDLKDEDFMRTIQVESDKDLYLTYEKCHYEYKGYHIASQKEIERLFKYGGKKIIFPIYVDVDYTAEWHPYSKCCDGYNIIRVKAIKYTSCTESENFSGSFHEVDEDHVYYRYTSKIDGCIYLIKNQ